MLAELLKTITHMQTFLTDERFIHGYYVGIAVGILLGGLLVSAIIVWSGQE